MRNAFFVVAAACAVAHHAEGQAVRPSTGAKLYVVNQSGASISVIDQDRLVVDTVLDLTTMGFTANAKPHHVAVERDGSAWYVSLIGDGKVLKINRANKVIGQVTLETPGLLSLDPVRDTLWVGRSMTAPNPPKALGVIQRSAFKLIDEQEVMVARPHALTTTHDGQWTHAASLAENRFASVEAATGRVVLTTLTGAFRSLVQFTVSPDGKTMVAGGELSNSVLFFDLTKPPPFTPATEVEVGGKPWDPVFSPNGKSIYFSLFQANTVVELDAKSRKVTRTFTGDFAQPYDLIMRADGKYLFLVNQNTGVTPKAGQSAHDNMPGMAGMPTTASKNGWLSVIDVKTGKTVKTLMLGLGPTGAGAAGAR